jgi:hypothetical protein
MVDREKLAYWIGVAQTDGFIYKKRKFPGKIAVCLAVNKKSMNMLNKFRQYSRDIFGLYPKPFYDKTNDLIVFRMGATRLKDFFKKHDIDFSDPPNPPTWICKSKKYFGAYFAGVIDGDGDVRIKRKNYPQCVVRITSGKHQNELNDSILRNISCSTRITKTSRTSFLNGREINGTWYSLEFYVSKKNLDFFDRFIVEHMAIDYKREKIKKFIKNRYAPAGIRTPASSQTKRASRVTR